MSRRPPEERGGFSLVETVVASLVIGLMLVAALNTVSASRVSQMKLDEQQLGVLLAEDLLAEILLLPYEDPDGDASGLGVESGESPLMRLAFDDIDDFAGWSSSPPQDASGASFDRHVGWARVVDVVFINEDGDEVSSDLGLKRIRVRVLRDGRQVNELEVLRASYARGA